MIASLARYCAVRLFDSALFLAVCLPFLVIGLLVAIVEWPLDWLRERVRGRYAWLERMDP